MKRPIFIMIITVLAASSGCIFKSSHSAKPIRYEDRLLVAVGDLQNRTGNPEYDSMMVEGLAGGLIHELHETECFRVVERQRLITVLEEMKLGMTGLLDPKRTEEVGNMLGVDAILFVDLASVRQNNEVNTAFIAKTEIQTIDMTLDARLVAVTTGEILATAKASPRYTKRIGTAFGFIRSGEKANQKMVVQESLEASLKELANEIAWQISRRRTS